MGVDQRDPRTFIYSPSARRNVRENDAIQSLFREIFGDQGSLIAKFGYAIIVTIAVTLITIRLSRYHSGE